jgi:argininosuccinate lyase
MVMMHLSRFSTDIITWSSSEYKYCEIGDAWTTGSSIMPQKKNPDVAELIRGKTGCAYGALIAILTLMKGTPLTYNRDFQEDKEPLFKAIDTVATSLDVFAQMLSSIKFYAVTMKKAIDSNIVATDLADYLVSKGVAFRSAHEMTGKIVAYCEKSGKEISLLTLWELRKFSSNIEEDIYDAITINNSIDKKDVIGGTAKNQVLKAIKAAKKRV